MEALRAENEALKQHSIRIEDHERILNNEMQKTEKAALEKLAKI